MSICRWILRSCPSRRFQSPSQRRRRCGDLFNVFAFFDMSKNFRMHQFAFKPAFEAHFMALQHDAVPWMVKKKKGHAKIARNMPVSLERKDSLERSQGGNVIRNDMPPLKLNPNRQKDVKPFPACDKLHIEMLPRKKTTQSNDIASFSCFYL